VSKRHPKSPAFFPPHCPAFSDTMNHPEPIHQSHDKQNIEGNRTFDKTVAATRAKYRFVASPDTENRQIATCPEAAFIGSYVSNTLRGFRQPQAATTVYLGREDWDEIVEPYFLRSGFLCAFCV
jgi:hypothetical protein